MKPIITSILCFAAFTVSAQVTDTLYYKNGDKTPCKIAVMNNSALAVYIVDSATQTLKYQAITKSILDSSYVTHPGAHNLTSIADETVGNNLIVSGVMTLVSSVAIIVGAQLDRFKEGAIVAGVAALISTATLINAGVVSNSKEPPPPELKHIIVY
jgi:hypothetical protein